MRENNIRISDISYIRLIFHACFMIPILLTSLPFELFILSFNSIHDSKAALRRNFIKYIHVYIIYALYHGEFKVCITNCLRFSVLLVMVICTCFFFFFCCFFFSWGGGGYLFIYFFFLFICHGFSILLDVIMIHFPFYLFFFLRGGGGGKREWVHCVPLLLSPAAVPFWHCLACFT